MENGKLPRLDKLSDILGVELLLHLLGFEIVSDEVFTVCDLVSNVAL